MEHRTKRLEVQEQVFSEAVDAIRAGNLKQFKELTGVEPLGTLCYGVLTRDGKCVRIYTDHQHAAEIVLVVQGWQNRPDAELTARERVVTPTSV